MGDFGREFGGLDANSEASYALQQFFLNGGTEAWAVRVASGTLAKATAVFAATVGGAAALTVTAISEGAWGNNLRVSVDTAGAAVGEFNLTISEFAVAGGASVLANQEVFRNLSMDSTKTNFAATVVNDPNSGSKLARVTPAGATAPLSSGTQSGDLSVFPLTAANPEVSVTIGSDGPVIAKFGSKPATLAATRGVLESAIRAAAADKPAFSGATVTVLGNKLVVLAGGGSPSATITFAVSAGDATTATELKVTSAAGATANVQAYKLGLTAAVAGTAQLAGIAGADGTPPDAAALIGDENAKTGLFALADVDLFNILCIPRTAVVSGANALTATQAGTVIAAATQYCARAARFSWWTRRTTSMTWPRSRTGSTPTPRCAAATPRSTSRASGSPIRSTTSDCAPSGPAGRSPACTPAPTARAASGRRRPAPRRALRTCRGWITG